MKDFQISRKGIQIFRNEIQGRWNNSKSGGTKSKFVVFNFQRLKPRIEESLIRTAHFDGQHPPRLHAAHELNAPSESPRGRLSRRPFPCVLETSVSWRQGDHSWFSNRFSERPARAEDPDEPQSRVAVERHGAGPNPGRRSQRDPAETAREGPHVAKPHGDRRDSYCQAARHERREGRRGSERARNLSAISAAFRSGIAPLVIGLSLHRLCCS